MTDVLVWIIWCEVFDMKCNFDRVVLFVNFAWLGSIDFTGVLNDWWDVNRLVLMYYFFIKYGVFGRVRGNALFSMVWGYFRMGYWWFLMWLECVKCLIFKRFVEVGIEVILVILGGLMGLINLIFEVEAWMEQIAWFTLSNTCFIM